MSESIVSARRGRNWLFLFCGLWLALPVHAEKTMMFMIDFWGQRDQTDTIIDLNVFQPSSEISYKGGLPPSPVRTNAYETERFGWWYALPNFNADDYSMGRIRINTLYKRGWYQNDSDYRASKGDTLFFPDSQTNFAYQNKRTGQNVVVPLGIAKPKFFVFPDTASYRGPKLYLSAGNSGTELMNMRPSTKGVAPLGNIDKCVDAIPADTVWVRWGSPTNLPGQQPTGADMSCTGYNPFSVRFAQVYLRNPWPGADQPVVEFNGQNIPLYPSANPDWLVADLRYLPTQGVPSGVIRFKQGPNSSNYFDSAGVEQATPKPFVIAAGGPYYFVPPEAGGGFLQGTGPVPAPLYTIFVQNPWKPGSPRLMWEDDKNLHVMRPTQSCGWFKYPVYKAPKRVLIGHSFEDSTYGSTGVQFRTRSNWIDIPASAINAAKEVYIQTRDASGNRIAATTTNSPALKDCSSDTIKLVMEAFDFKGREDANGNPAFQIGGAADAVGGKSSGLAKGMVLSTLKDGLPVWSGRDSGYQAGGIKAAPNSGKSSPSNWFDTVALRASNPGIAIGHSCLELPLSKNGPSDSGYYNYDNQNFFPLDTISDRRGYSPLLGGTPPTQHNFLFCLHGHAAFEYTPGLKFQFLGDDDVWVFINKKLAVDLGGTHGPEAANVDLDKLKLREGTVYPFDIFYCERQTNGSSIKIRTTMDLQPSWQYRATSTVVAGKIKVDIMGQESQNYVPSCADLTTKPLVWKKTTGRITVIGPDGSNLKDTYNTDVSLYGGNLSYTALDGTVELDTMALKLRPELMWPGKYTVRIESRLGDSLNAITFTKTYGVVVVDGLVLDGNGDGVADSIRLSASQPIFNDNPSYHLAWFNAAGQRDSILVPAAQVRKIYDSVVVAPLNKAWGRRTQIPAGARVDSMGAILTAPAGMAVTNPIKIRDGMAPYADSARLTFGISGANDTLRIWAAENAVQYAGATPADVWAKIGRSLVPRNLTVVDAKTNGREIVLVLPAGHGIGATDSVRVAGLVADGLQNPATNSAIWVPILSNPLGWASLFDTDGDGHADSVAVEVRGSLTGAKSVVVAWKDVAGTPVAKTWAVSGNPLGSFGVSGDADPFPKGATSCRGGGCSVTFLDGAGKTLQQWSLIDSVAPMALRARYSFGTSTDTLWVKFSEPLTSLSGTLPWLQWGSLGAVVSAVAQSEVHLVGSLDSGYFVLDTAKGIRAAYDSVRMASGIRPLGFLDQGGVPTGNTSPWAPLVMGLPPLEATLLDPSGLGRGTTVMLTPLRSVPAAALASIASLQVNWTDAQGLPSSRVVPFSAFAATGSTWTGTLPAPFDFGATACASGCSVVGSSLSGQQATWKLLDGVPPTLVRARYRFGSEGVSDTLVLRSSEPWVNALTSDNTAFALTGNTAAPKNATPKVWSLANGQDAYVILDTVANAAPKPGDSARLAGGATARVVDAAGNRPQVISPWVLIEFGLKPPTLVVKPYPAMRHNTKENAWVAPSPGIPATEMLIRDARPAGMDTTDADFYDPTTGLGPQNKLSQVLGIKILVNRPLTGKLIIYDNMGTHVAMVDLTKMSAAWADSTKKDAMREIWVIWNGTGADHKFVASGVYLFRAVVKVENGEGPMTLRNQVWKLGWDLDSK